MNTNRFLIILILLSGSTLGGFLACGDRTLNGVNGNNSDAASTNSVTALVINEFVAKGSDDIPPDGSSGADWLEIYNPDSLAVAINSNTVVVTDSDDDPDAYLWLPETNVPSYGYLVVWCDDSTQSESGKPLHAPFKLSGSGDSIYLLTTNSDSGTMDEIANHEFSSAEDGVAQGRLPDGSDTWNTSLSPSPGEANSE